MKQIHVVSLVMLTLIMVMLLPFFVILTSTSLPKINPNTINEGKTAEKEPAPSSRTESVPIKEYKPREYRIENVKKVFIHTPGSHYSVLYETGHSKQLINSGDLRNHWFVLSTPKFMDVRPGIVFNLFNDIRVGSGYVLMRDCGNNMYIIEIHTHIENIGGGDFEYRERVKDSPKTGTTRTVE